MEIDALVPVSRVGVDERTRDVAPPNPAEVLAQLMDFSGSVTVAELLQAPPPPSFDIAPAHPNARELAWKLQDSVQKQLSALSTNVLRPLTGRHAPLHLPAAELLASMTRIVGSPSRVPDAPGIEQLARELGEPYFNALYKSVQQAEVQVHSLRVRITAELRQLGPRAARLEHIDSALQRSMQAKQIELFERLVLAAELTFERGCARACAELPESFGVADLARWSAEDGWLDRYRERCVRMTQALFGHLQRGLEGLVVAAVHAEIS